MFSGVFAAHIQGRQWGHWSCTAVWAGWWFQNCSSCASVFRVVLLFIIIPALLELLICLGLCRDSLDWHRLVLGGRRRVKIKDRGQFYSDGGGVLDIGGPSQQCHGECSAPHSQQQMGGETAFEQSPARCVFFSSVWMPWFLFQEKTTFKCPAGPQRDCSSCM